MRVILDTNVVVSGLFFGGAPRRILELWREGALEWVITSQILEEYRRVGSVLGRRECGPVLGLRSSPGHRCDAKEAHETSDGGPRR